MEVDHQTARRRVSLNRTALLAQTEPGKTLAPPKAEDVSEQCALPDAFPTLIAVPYPSDRNLHGDVFGGWIISQIDVAGVVVASQLAKGHVVTVAMNPIVFKKPVFVGDLVSFYAKVIKTGRTSIEVGVEVYARRALDSSAVVKVTEAAAVYVHIGEDRKPRALPTATSLGA